MATRSCRSKNDYDKEVYNGDIGYVVDLDSESGELTGSLDSRSVTYGFGELDVLVPAQHRDEGRGSIESEDFARKLA